MSALDRLRCSHGMPNPAACVDCMEDGHYLPSTARKVLTLAGIGGYAFENDCTVQALVEAVGATYEEAAEALAAHGWVPGRGATFETLADAVRTLGFEVRAPGLSTLVDLQRASESGRVFLVRASIGRKGHAWVVVDGAHVNAGRYLAKGTNIRATEIVA